MSMSGGVALNQGIALLHPIARYKVMRQLKSLVSAVQFWSSYSHLTFSTHQFLSRYPLGSSPLTCAGVSFLSGELLGRCRAQSNLMLNKKQR